MRTFFVTFSLLICAVILTYVLGCFYSYFYPLKYQDEISVVSAKYDVDKALIASVINVESGYNENAISQKGARGLMQIMPSTAEWLSNKLGKEYSDEKLLQADYNIELGGYYISYLIDKYQNVEVGLCAYNAGPQNVNNWLNNNEYSSDGKTLNKIPFKETRDYINKVNKNYYYYKNRFK